MEQTLQELKLQAGYYDYRVYYALKANSNNEILKIIKSHGFGADCVSSNEINRAVDAGFEPGKIVFAGIGKSDAEIKTGLSQDIFA